MFIINFKKIIYYNFKQCQAVYLRLPLNFCSFVHLSFSVPEYANYWLK